MKTCALCGQEILTRDESAEHVPPKLFFPKALRPTIRERFWTVPSHQECNAAHKLDEEYIIPPSWLP
jgi:hypothetical protein